MCKVKAKLLAIGIVIWSVPALASEGLPFGDTLTGDWGGLRTDLHNRGVDIQLGYVAEIASNLQGGATQETRYADQFTFGATLDLDRLLGLNQAQFQMTITERNGRNLSSDAQLGSLQQVQEVYGRGQTWRITQLWFNQKYFNGLIDWKIGRLTVGEDFASFSCDFMNLTFCGAQPGNIVGDYWFNWPVSQWATRIKIAVHSFGYIQLGVFEVNPSYLERRHAFSLGTSGATGALIPLEVGWLPKLGAAGLPGSYKLGTWYDTSQAKDVFENTQGQPLVLAGGQPRNRDGRYGFYLNFAQQVTQPSAPQPWRGLSIFLNASFADRETATLDNQIAIGMVYSGLFDFRPYDDLGLAIGRTHVNNRVTRSEELQNAAGLGPVAVQKSEYVAEIYYGLQLTQWLMLRPNLQYVYRPGGVEKITDDVILGLKLQAKM